jgi:dihydropyrimidine dehydrogenase (NAD+) subunit PreA
MADLTTDCAGIKSPNPFWIASGPPANTAYQVMRAFDAGWGGAVWKTIGEPIVNTSSRYGSVDLQNLRMMGLNNIELISDRPIEENLREIAEVKKRYPKHAVIASLMVESKREVWHDIVKRAEDSGADGLELNFGCPHGMSERGMGAAVGQVPEYTKLITSWVKEVARTPVLVKLTPNISVRAGPTGSRSSTPSTASWGSTSTRWSRGPWSMGARPTAATAGPRSSRSP